VFTNLLNYEAIQCCLRAKKILMFVFDYLSQFKNQFSAASVALFAEKQNKFTRGKN
jgi:hypothetical protein